MKKLETVRKLVRQTTAQGESSNLKEELQVEELLQQVEEMKLALQGVNPQFQENQKALRDNSSGIDRIQSNQKIIHQDIQELQEEVQRFRKERWIGNWILRMVYFGLIIVIGINMGMLVGSFLK
jgi:hypothetical protein